MNKYVVCLLKEAIDEADCIVNSEPMVFDEIKVINSDDLLYPCLDELAKNNTPFLVVHPATVHKLASAVLQPVQSRILPSEFTEAMHKYKAIVEQYGEESLEARKSFIAAMQLAPDWFMDDVTSSMGEDFLPQASGYLDDGSPVFNLEDIAEKFGVSAEDAAESLEEMMAVREELGLSNEGKLIHPSSVHRKQ